MKVLEPKCYIRIGDDGQPELIRSEPIIDELGMVDMEKIRVTLDNGEPHDIPRAAFKVLLSASSAVSLEEATNWKHKRVH